MIGTLKTRQLAGFRIAWLLPCWCCGCPSVNSEADRQIAAQTMPRPAVIVVSDFAITPEEVISGRSGPRLTQGFPRSAIERAVGHRFASAFATGLVEEIRKMGLAAEPAGAPLAPGGGNIVSIEGQFVSLNSGDVSAPGIVGFTADLANVVADIQIYSTTKAGDRLSEDLEFDLADANQPPERMPPGELTRLRSKAGSTGRTEGELPAATAAELDQAARATASAAARQLATFFADQRWIGPAQNQSRAGAKGAGGGRRRRRRVAVNPSAATAPALPGSASGAGRRGLRSLRRRSIPAKAGPARYFSVNPAGRLRPVG